MIRLKWTEHILITSVDRDQGDSHYFTPSGLLNSAEIRVNTMIFALSYLYKIYSLTPPWGELAGWLATPGEDEKGSHLKEDKQKCNVQVDTL